MYYSLDLEIGEGPILRGCITYTCIQWAPKSWNMDACNYDDSCWVSFFFWLGVGGRSPSNFLALAIPAGFWKVVHSLQISNMGRTGSGLVGITGPKYSE